MMQTVSPHLYSLAYLSLIDNLCQSLCIIYPAYILFMQWQIVEMTVIPLCASTQVMQDIFKGKPLSK